MKHKYVRISGLGFVLFPMTHFVMHSDVERLFGMNGRVVSAGFVEFKDGAPHCFGRSESIGIGSAPGDSADLASQLGSH